MLVGRGVYSKKKLVSDCKKLDILNLSGKCDLDSKVVGSISWTNSLGKKSEIGLYSIDQRVLVFSYTITKRYTKEEKTFEYLVHLDKTPCNYGGMRWWFRCPNCNRRCRILYLPPGRDYFLCRICHNLTYTSQQVGKTKFNRLLDAVTIIPELERQLLRTRSSRKRQIIERKIERLYYGMRGSYNLNRRRKRRRRN